MILEEDASHVAVTPDDSELEDLFADLAANISRPGATNIVINEVINPDFVITSILLPTKGTAMSINPTTLQWKIPELGVSGNEGATLEFYIRHISQSSGTKPVNQSITYSDTEGNSVTFPDPAVKVDCGITVTPEPCPTPVNFTVDGCEDYTVVDLGDTYLESTGRIVELNVTVRSVCPYKRVALGIILTEIDCNGSEHPRGVKTFTIPAHNYPACRDILVKCIRFVLPNDLSVSCAAGRGMCGARNLKARVQKEYGLDVNPDIPLFSMISRIADQKGYAELLGGNHPVLEELLEKNDFQLIVIGTGDKHYEEKLLDLQTRHSNLSVNLVFSAKAAHEVEGASDFFLMPSRYEPCGLNQMYSLHYGTLPVAHRTGGLADTITDLTSDPAHGTGFLMDDLSSETIMNAVERAICFYGDKDGMKKAIRRAMTENLSWERSAGEYLALYNTLMKRK